MFSVQRMVLFPRHLIPTEDGAGDAVHGLQRLTVPSPDGPVEGWFIPGDGVGPDRPGPVVIFAHGNAEIIDHWPGLLAPYGLWGVSLLLAEYRGYGRSAGAPSQSAITRDLVAFHDLLIQRPDVDPGRVVYHGRSLGGGAVCALSRRRPPAAMILQSTFISVRRLARRFLIPGFLVRDPFDNLAALSESRWPVLIVHGRQDSLIPFAHAEALHAAAPDSRLIPCDSDHNDCPPDWMEFWRHVERFLRPAGITG